MDLKGHPHLSDCHTSTLSRVTPSNTCTVYFLVLQGSTLSIGSYTSNSHEAYYIGHPSTLDAADSRLLSIRPPHHFTRLPRTVRDRCYWKAHEWRNWLLLYCIPCCCFSLPQRYLRHFALLSEAILILLCNDLTMDQINHAGEGAHAT